MAATGKTPICFYLRECNICNFQKIFPSPKMAAILNFRIFAKNGKTQIASISSISLTVRDRAISSKIFDPQII